MKGATDSDQRESSVSYRIGTEAHKWSCGMHPGAPRRPHYAWRPRPNHPNPPKTTPDPFMGFRGDTEWMGCGRGSLAVSGTHNVRG